MPSCCEGKDRFANRRTFIDRGSLADHLALTTITTANDDGIFYFFVFLDWDLARVGSH